jgi:hypothetical protein
MSEERMIRIKAPSLKTKIHYRIRVFSGLVQDSWPDEYENKLEFEQLEPAPPKDCSMRSVDEIMNRLKSLFDYAVELGECTPEGIEEFRRWLTSQNTQQDDKQED